MSPFNAGAAEGQLILDSTKWTSSLTKSQKGLKNWAKANKTQFLAIGAVATATFAAITFAIKKSVDAMAEQEVANAKLMASMKSTGVFTQELYNDYQDLANELQTVTTFSNDLTVAAIGIATTFTKISKDIMPEAIEAAMDMSTVFGSDLKQSMLTLGIALNVPITGIGRLSRIGVIFTEQQKEMIKSLAEAGNVMAAQKIILAELQVEVGGAARAVGETFAGQVAQLQNRFGDITKVIGKAVIPILEKLIDFIDGSIMPALEDWAGGIEGVIDDESMQSMLEIFKSFANGFVFTLKWMAKSVIGFTTLVSYLATGIKQLLVLMKGILTFDFDVLSKISAIGAEANAQILASANILKTLDKMKLPELKITADLEDIKGADIRGALPAGTPPMPSPSPQIQQPTSDTGWMYDPSQYKWQEIKSPTGETIGQEQIRVSVQLLDPDSLNQSAKEKLASSLGETFQGMEAGR